MFETIRKFWKVWSEDPLYYRTRRVKFGIVAPVTIAGTIVLLVIQQWTAAAMVGAAATLWVIDGLLAKVLARGRQRSWRLGVLACMLVAVVTWLVVIFVTAPGLPRDSGPLPTRGGLTSVSRTEPLYSRVAGELVGRTVEVRCWSGSDWARLSHEASVFTHGRVRPGPWGAYTSDDHHLVNLSPRVCGRLGLLAYRRLVPRTYADAYWLSWSLATLALQAKHYAGEKDDAKAGCFGMQSIARVAVGLGLDDNDAAALARLYWRRIYPFLPPHDRSAECVNGGRLDLRPQSDSWP